MADVVGFDQRDVARQRQQVETFRRQAPRRRHDRAGVPFAGALAHDAGAVAGGDGGGRGIDRDHHDAGKLAHALMAAITSSNMASASSCRRAAGSSAARRCLACAVSLTGTTAQIFREACMSS